jgi:hypothetical protein
VFILNMARSAVTTLYLSSLSWVEFVHVLCLATFRESLPLDMHDRFRLAAWDE